MDKQAAHEKIDALLAEANAKLEEAANVAREAGVSFSWDGPTYGMGGWFDPEVTTDAYGDQTEGWQASSYSC